VEAGGKELGSWRKRTGKGEEESVKERNESEATYVR
jgi:hypothetical protein